jgi:hypothetical protein
MNCRHVCKTCTFHDALQVPDQESTVDFFLFPHLKSMMKGARFAEMAAIQHVTAVL